MACPEVINWQEEQEGACLVITAIPGVPAADLSGADLLKAWPSMGQQLGAVHSLSVDQCPFERRLSRMFGRAVDVVSRNAVNPDFLPDEDKSTPQLDLLARVERELPVRLDQERTDMVVCHGDPCMPNFMVDPKTLQCTGLIDLGRLEQQIAMPIWHLRLLTPKRTGQRQMKQSAPSLSYSMYWGSKPPTANALPSICDWTL